MTNTRAADSRTRRSTAIAATALLLTLLSGCATGSSASFSQAPLLFTEQSATVAKDISAAPVSQSTSQSVSQAGLDSNAALTNPTYVAIDGNAILPVATTAALLGDVTGALTQVTSRLPGALPVSIQSPVSIQLPTATGLPVAANLPTASLGLDANGSTAASLQVGPLVTAALAPAQATTAVTSTATGLVSTALVLTQPVLTGATAQPVAPGGSSLLTVSAGNLVRICLLKGCR